MTINEKIFYIINEKGLKQSELAKKLQLTTGQITAWKKRGTTPPAEYLINICKFLGISIYELLGEEEQELTEEEEQLLNYFRRCNAGNRQIILSAASSLSSQSLEQDSAEKSSALKIG